MTDAWEKDFEDLQDMLNELGAGLDEFRIFGRIFGRFAELRRMVDRADASARLRPRGVENVPRGFDFRRPDVADFLCVECDCEVFGYRRKDYICNDCRKQEKPDG